MMMHSKGNRHDCPQLNDSNHPTMAIIENHHFKRMAQHAYSNRVDLIMTWEITQTSTVSETMVTELCPDCTDAAKAVNPGFMP